jgi:hypothetical protein
MYRLICGEAVRDEAEGSGAIVKKLVRAEWVLLLFEKTTWPRGGQSNIFRIKPLRYRLGLTERIKRKALSLRRFGKAE